jgi:hypothetical protein
MCIKCTINLITYKNSVDSLDIPPPQKKPGKDGSEAFEDVGHSPDARELQQQYLIGEVTEPAAKRPKVS